jgi:hypothetical protein
MPLPETEVKMSGFKLGKLEPKRLLSTPAFGDFLGAVHTWPAVKPRGWEYAVPPEKLDILANDELGDCVIAAMMHYAQAETANTSNPLTPTRNLAIQTYSAITGYDPKYPDSDQGTCWIDALKHWKQFGIPMLDKNGNQVLHHILGYASLDLHSVAQQRYACDLFGGTLMGVNLPQSAEDDLSDWRYVPGSPIIGGHGINRAGQGGDGWHISSWGRWIKGTWEFSLKLADEDYAVVSKNWVDSETGQTPSGLDLNGLLAAFKQL